MSRTFSLTFDDELQQGLRPDFRIGRNKGALTKCKNMKPSPGGLMGIPALTFPFSRTAFYTLAWPFPQLIKGRGVTLLVGNDEIYYVNEGTDPWTYGNNSPGYTNKTAVALTALDGGAAAADEAWHFVDFGSGFWVLLNGSVCIMQTGAHNVPSEITSDYANNVYVWDTSTPQTGTQLYSKGITLLGGFGSTDTDTQWDALGENVVVWGSPGMGDSLWHFMSSLMTADLEQWHLRVNLRNYAVMPFKGQVKRMLPLGDDTVMVYGEDGVAALTWGPSTGSFGVKEILPYGVQGRCAAQTDARNERHIWIDEEGCIWSIDRNLQPQRLDYSEWTNSMLSNQIVISYDPSEQDWWICDGTTCLVLTPFGMGESTQIPSSLVHADGALCGIFATGAGETTMQLIFDTFDMATREIKRMNHIHFGMTDVTSATATARMKYNMGTTWKTGSATRFNTEGQAYLGKCGVDFQLQLDATLGTTAPKVDYGKIAWQKHGKAADRGI